MALFEEPKRIDAAIAQHRLSKRAAYGYAYRDLWGPRVNSMGNPWSPDNPSGTIIFRLAENSLMHDEITEYINTHTKVHSQNHLTYSTGPRGSLRLRRAAANYISSEFQARKTITADNIFITPGVASAIDALTWSICNEGEGILVPRPFYNGFNFDTLNRSNAKLVGIAYAHVEGYHGIDDLFSPDINKVALETALQKAKEAGITIRALLISNPHNPLGRCYPPKTLIEFASFCERHQLHLISDEIYAKSVFANTTMPKETPFSSILSLNLENVINPSLLHVLYGASKDFCANGLRLGLVCTGNEGILGAMSSISMFSWSPHVIQDVWASMLEDKEWIEEFMRKKTDSMVEQHRIIASFLREHNINYYESNAGLFVWVDLRRLVKSLAESQALLSSATPNSLPAESDYEQVVVTACGNNGVMIAPGNIYGSEEPGWFRITFTVGEGALKEGLERFRKSLVELQARVQA
ncbi:pyridoxal phosphate-dependent transferase [Nemania sp. FL0031]|nr:pyridoxal phosphate-dependent transferase [Nemania sp. FL0031]